jgi:hypothetical protein
MENNVNIFGKIETDKKKKYKIRNILIITALVAILAICAVILFRPQDKQETPAKTDSDDPSLVADNLTDIKTKTDEIIGSGTPDANERAIRFLDAKIAKSEGAPPKSEQWYLWWYLFIWRAGLMLETGGMARGVADDLSAINTANLEDTEQLQIYVLLQTAYFQLGESDMADMYQEKQNEINEREEYVGGE